MDVNFMFRIPLWAVKNMDSRPVGIWQAVGIQVVDVHELAAGKLSALLSRRQARDLFDCSNLFRLGGLEWKAVNVKAYKKAFKYFDALKDNKYKEVPDVLKLDHHSFVIEPLSLRALLRALRLVDCVFDRHEQGGEKAAAVTFILFSFFGYIMIFE